MKSVGWWGMGSEWGARRGRHRPQGRAQQPQQKAPWTTSPCETRPPYPPEEGTHAQCDAVWLPRSRPARRVPALALPSAALLRHSPHHHRAPLIPQKACALAPRPPATQRPSRARARARARGSTLERTISQPAPPSARPHHPRTARARARTPSAGRAERAEWPAAAAAAARPRAPARAHEARFRGRGRRHSAKLGHRNGCAKRGGSWQNAAPCMASRPINPTLIFPETHAP